MNDNILLTFILSHYITNELALIYFKYALQNLYFQHTQNGVLF